MVKVTYDLEISAISTVTITCGLHGHPPVPTQMHKFTCNCKPAVQGFSLRAASCHPHCSVTLKSNHPWDPSGHHREVMEKCHLQADCHPGQLITAGCQWLFLNSRGLPTLHRHHRGQVDVHTWKVKAIKKRYLISCPGLTMTDGRSSQRAHGMWGMAHCRSKT